MGCSPSSNPNYTQGQGEGGVADQTPPRVAEPQVPPPQQVRPQPASSTVPGGTTNTDGASSPSFATDSGRRQTVDFSSEMDEMSGVVPGVGVAPLRTFRELGQGEGHPSSSAAGGEESKAVQDIPASAPPTDDAFSMNQETGPAYELWHSRRADGNGDDRAPGGARPDQLQPTIGIQTSQATTFEPQQGESSNPQQHQQAHLPPPPLAVSVGLGSGRADGAILAESTNALSRDSNDPEKSLFRVMIDPKLKTSSNSSLLLPAGRSQDSGLALDQSVPAPPMTSTTTQVGSACGSLDSGGSTQSNRRLQFDVARLAAATSGNGSILSGNSLAGLPTSLGGESTSTSNSSDSRKATRDEVEYFRLSAASRTSSSATPSSPSTDATSRDTSLLMPSSQ